jgi:hypothetical protein
MRPKETEMTEATVPVVIEEEAALRIARLQLQKELELAIGWVREYVPELRGIRIVDHDPRPGEERILIWAHEAGPPWKSVPESPDYRFITWIFEVFPPEVRGKVSMWTTPVPMPSAPCEGKASAAPR